MKYVIKVDRDFSISQQVWNSLYSQDKESTIYQSYQWNKNFYFKLSSELKLHNLIFYHNENCIAIFPLIERVCNNNIILEFIGSRMVDYLSPIVLEDHKQHIYEQFKCYIKNNNYSFYGYDIKSTHSFCKCFSNKFKTIEICYLKQNTSLPISIVKENEYDKRYLSKNFTYSIEDTSDINDYYEHIKLYLENMKNIKNHTIDEVLKNFWKDYISSNIDNLHCINLKIENELAYSILYEIKDNKLFLINYAFNMNFKKYAPGKLLLIYLIKKYSAKYDIDFSRGKDEYKIKFGCEVHSNIKFLYPANNILWAALNKLEFNIGFFPHKLDK